MNRRKFATITGLSVLHFLGRYGSRFPDGLPLSERRSFEVLLPFGFGSAHSMCFDSDGGLHVLCVEQQTIWTIQVNGEFSRCIRIPSLTMGSILRIHQENGEPFFFIIDPSVGAITKLDHKGELVMAVGSVLGDNFRARRFSFIQPNEISVDSQGNIFVLDGAASACIHKFSPSGDYVQTFQFPHALVLSISSITTGKIFERDALVVSNPFYPVIYCLSTDGLIVHRAVPEALITFASSNSNEVVGVSSQCLYFFDQRRRLPVEMLDTQRGFSQKHVCVRTPNTIQLLQRRSDNHSVQITTFYV